MKRSYLIVPAALLLLLVLGCSGDSPTTVPGMDNPAAEKTSPWVYGSFQQDIVQPCECLGEDIWFHGEFAFRYMEISNTGGRYVYRWQGLPVTPDSPPFVAVGVTSGKVYEYHNFGAIFEMVLSGANEVYLLRDKELYVAADGTKLVVHFDLQFVTNGNGELVVSREMPWLIECWH